MPASRLVDAARALRWFLASGLTDSRYCMSRLCILSVSSALLPERLSLHPVCRYMAASRKVCSSASNEPRRMLCGLLLCNLRMLRFAWSNAVLRGKLDQLLSLRIRRIFDDPTLDQSYPSLGAVTVCSYVYVAHVPL
jgi:hypothetical protein